MIASDVGASVVGGAACVAGVDAPVISGAAPDNCGAAPVIGGVAIGGGVDGLERTRGVRGRFIRNTQCPAAQPPMPVSCLTLITTML